MTEDNKQEPKIKVTDRRMFTADGKLREGFEHLEDADAGAAAKPPKRPAEAPQAAEPPRPEAPKATGPAPRAEADPPPPGAPGPQGDAADAIPGGAGALGTPSFLELIGILAEPIAIYLGDARLPDGGSAENLDAARFYIDLLDVLRAKTEGNLTPREASVLEDLLYQLRMRYVRKRG